MTCGKIWVEVIITLAIITAMCIYGTLLNLTMALVVIFELPVEGGVLHVPRPGWRGEPAPSIEYSVCALRTCRYLVDCLFFWLPFVLKREDIKLGVTLVAVTYSIPTLPLACP